MRYLRLLLFGVIVIFFAGCQKQAEWLDERVNRSAIIPNKLADYQAMLDADLMFQGYGYLGRNSTDHFYVTEADYLSAGTDMERTSYTWAQDIYGGRVPNEWSRMYALVSIANICLEGVAKLPAGDPVALRNQVLGTALFYRGLAYYHMLQIFSEPYDAATASVALGVPLRLSPDVNELPARATVSAVYAQLIADLSSAVELLPLVSTVKVRANKQAARVQLARAYLMTEEWAKAEAVAATVLTDNPVLHDFNKLSATANFTFNTLENNNAEVIHYAEGNSLSIVNSNKWVCDSNLFKLYGANDLRKTLFFRTVNNLPVFKGQYTGRITPFAGIAYNEAFLIHAEAAARQGKVSVAMQSLNQLLVTRYVTGKFVALTAVSAQDALDKILVERRKELPFTGAISWEDLRRLNRDSRYQRTMVRKVGTTTYTLLPGSKRYTFLIPEIEVQLTGVVQNERP